MKPLRLPVLIAVLLCSIASLVQAADLGTISGRVMDKRTGHAIPFASVSLPVAKRGGLTDSEGQFTIPNVSPGTYEVRVQYLGYKLAINSAVVVTAGGNTKANFQLEDVIVHEEKQVEVSAERRLVEVKQGATMRSVTANDIRNLAVSTVSDVLQQQAGVSTDAEQIHIRGGRSDETVFVVNGVANRDLVTGQSTAGQINARSVSEVNVATGAYDVRYGNALSGVVEIKLKEGSDKQQIGVTTGTGSYGGRMWQVVQSGPDRVWTPALRLLGVKLPGTVTSVLDVSNALSETRYSYLGSHLNLLRQTLTPPEFHPPLHSSYEDSFFGHTFTYGDRWSPAEDNRWSARYGVFWKPNVKDKISLTLSKRIAIDQGFSRTFLTAQGDLGDPAYPWIWYHRIGNASTFFEDNVQSELQWRRSLSTTGFMEAQVSRSFFAQRQDVAGKAWADYVEPDDRGNFPLGDPRRDDYFIDSGDGYQWSDRRTTSWAAHWGVTQRLHHNELEAGFEHQWQTVQYLTIEYPWIYDKDGLGESHDQWLVHPWVGDVYVRDRIEYEGFAANVGLRGDYWVVGREAEIALGDTTRHNIAPSERTGFYNNTRSFFGRRMKLHLSPRVIVSHPITENSSFFFNYGEFTQVPSYRYVYSKLNSISSESFPIQGNPNLNPQVSVNYEVGAKHQFLPTAAANLTFFVRDVYDYPSASRVDPLTGTSLQSYFVYLNGDFARSKGVEIELEKRRSHHWAGKLSYSYQQTKGKSGSPNQQVALQEIGGSSETRLSEVFVSWNRPHKLTGNLDIRFDNETPHGFGLFKHTGVNMFVQGQSGRAFTPMNELNSNAIGLPYSRNAQFQVTTDLKLSRYFRLMGRRFDLSLQGNNIFGTEVIYRIDPITGKGYKAGAGLFDPAVFNLTPNYITGSLNDPSNYGGGAAWRLQFDVDL
jgi:hypothetical protein